MPGCINQVKIIGVPVFCGIGETDGLAYNSDAAFALNVHRIEDLIFKIPLRNNIGGFDQAIRQRGFAVINMGNDTEVSDILHFLRIDRQVKEIIHIFDEFYKVDESRHDMSSVGLGLAICKRIVEKHNGKIWAASQGKGKGTTMYISLPT